MLVKLREASPEGSIDDDSDRPSGRSSPRRDRRRAGVDRLVTPATAHAFAARTAVASASAGDVLVDTARVGPSVAV